jgi:uncharacterized protein RhaS with RHS repeats
LAEIEGESYYRARYYDSNPGRFLSEDPIDFAGGINFYAYVQNDPLNLADPLGLRATKAATADCIAQGLQALFPGVAATVGPATKNVGGHWNFPVIVADVSMAKQNNSRTRMKNCSPTFIASACIQNPMLPKVSRVILRDNPLPCHG